MRLIISYVVSDGCTYSCTVIEPVVYKSKDDLLHHFAELCEDKLKNPFKQIHFTNDDVVVDINDLILDGKYFLPAIYTIDEFFEANGHYNE